MVDEPNTSAVPIPRTLEVPPRTTGNPQMDLPILIDWFYRAYQVIQQAVLFINSQVDDPNFNPSNLPDPSNTTLAAAQQTANNAYTLAQQAQTAAGNAQTTANTANNTANTANNTANTAINRLNGFIHGDFTLGSSDIGAEVTFSQPQPNADYRVIVQAKAVTGTPNVNSLIVKEKIYANNKFTVTMAATPGGSATVTIEWQLIRNS